MKKIIFMIFVITFLFSFTAEAKTVAKESINGYSITVVKRNGRTTVKWNGKNIHSYKFKGKVKIVSERKLTEKMLMRRKNKTIYIERIIGKVVNERLDGKTTDGNYICYKSLRGKVHKGDVVVTYCVYNPFTKWIDDIDERYDVILQKAR